MTGTVYLGIDPGAKGGLAAIFPDGSIDMTPMPSTIRDVWEWISRYSPYPKPFATPCHAYIEKVGGYMGAEAGESGTRNKAAAHVMFTFGRNVGHLEAFLTSAQIPHEEIYPRAWVKVLGISPRSKSESKSQWKSRLKQKAQQLFPQEHITLQTCDALLIAECCRRYYLTTTK